MSHCWNHTVDKGRARIPVLNVFLFNVFLDSLCYSVITVPVVFKKDSRTWNNRESKSRIKAGLFISSLIPSPTTPPPTPSRKKTLSYSHSIWKNWFKLNSRVTERNLPNNWANKLLAKWWDWTKIKAWLMPRNCWILLFRGD